MTRIAVLLWIMLAGIVAAQQAPQFTGKSEVMDGKNLTVARRHFDAGARTYWHSHSNGQLLMVACLWSKWTAPGQPELLSFAAITDEPPAEVEAAGHDRCIVPIKRENVDAWLNPQASDLAALDAILEDRDRPYYEHRLAA